MQKLRAPPDGARFRLLDGFLSGGSFCTYVTDAVRESPLPVCLCLRAAAYGFTLPCKDGQGTLLRETVSGGQFSESFCEFFLWSDGQPYDAILYDNDESIRKKLEIAEACGVNYCFIEP